MKKNRFFSLFFLAAFLVFSFPDSSTATGDEEGLGSSTNLAESGDTRSDDDPGYQPLNPEDVPAEIEKIPAQYRLY